MAIPSFSVLSLCSGIGGLDLGVRLAVPSARTVCYVENEIKSCEVLVSRMAEKCLDDAPVWSDLKTFDGKPWRGAVDCIIAGYPCQPFSSAGRKQGAKDPRHLWPHVGRIIRETGAPCVFLENVDNHLRIGFREVANELRRMGYRVQAGIFSAEAVGATHQRKRLFALAYSEGRGLGILRESPGLGGLTDGRCAQLENAARSEREGSHGKVSGRRGRVRETGYGLGDSLCTVSTAGSGVHTNGRTHTAARSELTGKGLADSGRKQRSRGPGSEDSETSGACNAAAGLREVLFPPGPNEIEGWRQYLKSNPGTQPSVCRGVNGFPSRVDRLRMLGNGVFPLVAADAFLTLADAALTETTDCLRAAA